MKKKAQQKKTKDRPRKSVSRTPSGKKAVCLEEEDNFCVVGLGASAGGLEALERFFNRMPADSGLAFVVVQHLDPVHKSMMVDLLRRRTEMKVNAVEDGTKVQPNQIYIIPPNRSLAILKGKLHLMEFPAGQPFRAPIDLFFRSLAEDMKEKAICIVLSGTGSDGALGLKAIKEAGGITMAQGEGTAKYDSMPNSAIATGCVDHILSVDDMPAQLMKYLKHPYISKALKFQVPAPQELNTLEKILILIRSEVGHDFVHYKRNTIHRRIERRMALHQIERIEDYLRYLQQNREEVRLLFKELLIGVTSFFRDRESFEALRKKVISSILDQKLPDTAVRIWAPGCATGEEPYSIAILLAEEVKRRDQSLRVQIFATDIDPDALATARSGVYPESIAVDVPPKQLKEFFTKAGAFYRIKREIREMVIFAKQDLIQDPPFSKLDLIVCRNLLIYLDAFLQKRVFPIFHYALLPDRFIMLGPSETIGEFADLFSLIDKRWKIFKNKSSAKASIDFSPSPLSKETLIPFKRERARVDPGGSLIHLTEKVLLESYAPPCVIVNEEYDIVHFQGKTDRFLEPPTGVATLNILKMARDGLRIELRGVLKKAFERMETTIYPGVRMKENRVRRVVNLVAKPFQQESAPKLVMVIFEEVAPPPAGEETHSWEEAGQVDQTILELEEELHSTRESLQTTIEELETSNEEIKSSNEEFQSTNEELQSANEELETSREELQSINEELVTVNSELQGKLDELAQTNNDIVNLMNVTNVGTIFLDTHLKIKRFTPIIQKVIRLIPSDLGRPIGDITLNFTSKNLPGLIERVLETLIPEEREIQTQQGEWYTMKILPYRMINNKVDGAVLSFLNISDQKARYSAEAALRYSNRILGALREPLLVLDKELKVLSATADFYKTFGLQKEEVEGQLIYRLDGGQWNIPELRRLLEEVLPTNAEIKDFKVERNFGRTGPKKLRLNARKIDFSPEGDSKETELILLSIEDQAADERFKSSAG